MATSAQQIAALGRRTARWNARVQWYGEQVTNNIHMGMLRRLKITAQLLRDKVVINLSIPVLKQKSKRTGRIVVDPASRSKPGEFPRADTTRLMKDIFWEVDDSDPRNIRAYVGTTLDYGLFLEMFMDRSFLRRTLNEESARLAVIMAAPTGPAGPLPGQQP